MTGCERVCTTLRCISHQRRYCSDSSRGESVLIDSIYLRYQSSIAVLLLALPHFGFLSLTLIINFLHIPDDKIPSRSFQDVFLILFCKFNQVWQRNFQSRVSNLEACFIILSFPSKTSISCQPIDEFCDDFTWIAYQIFQLVFSISCRPIDEFCDGFTWISYQIFQLVFRRYIIHVKLLKKFVTGGFNPTLASPLGCKRAAWSSFKYLGWSVLL